MESDDFTRHYIIRYLSARELVLPPPAHTERRMSSVLHVSMSVMVASQGFILEV